MGTSPLDSALRWAAKLHKGQVRDGPHPLPYLVHPVEVVANLRHLGGVVDEPMLVAAALHDVVEECDVAPEEIEERFGKQVGDLVAELTRTEPPEAQTKAMDQDAVWHLRSDLLLEDIGRMGAQAQAIKLADRLSNVREAIRTKERDKVLRYLWQTERLLEIIDRGVNEGLWDAVAIAAKTARFELE